MESKPTDVKPATKAGSSMYPDSLVSLPIKTLDFFVPALP